MNKYKKITVYKEFNYQINGFCHFGRIFFCKAVGKQKNE